MKASQTKSATVASQPKALRSEVLASFNEIEGANKELRSFKTFMLITMTNFAVKTLQEQARSMAAQRLDFGNGVARRADRLEKVNPMGQVQVNGREDAIQIYQVA